MGFLALSMLFGLVVASSLNLAAEAAEEGSSASEKFAGTDKDDYFDAKNGNDLLIGQGGNDTLAGGNGNDWLVGAAGTDLLKGDAGADVIIGGSGVDTLVGGAGNDFIEAANIVDTPRLDASLTLTSSFRDIAFEYSLPNTSDEGDSIDAGAGDDTISWAQMTRSPAAVVPMKFPLETGSKTTPPRPSSTLTAKKMSWSSPTKRAVASPKSTSPETRMKTSRRSAPMGISSRSFTRFKALPRAIT